MRPCFEPFCFNGVITTYIIETGSTEKEVCTTCSGTGEVEEGCYCAAYEPSECCCGAWDDVDYNDWYNEAEGDD